MSLVKGNLFEFPCDMIVHQLNCLTVEGKGLYSDVVQHYPYADVYKERKRISSWKNMATPATRGVPGTCVLRQGEQGPIVAGLCAQWDVSNPYNSKRWNRIDEKDPHYGKYGDTREDRLQWFKQALDDLASQLKDEVKVIAFPHKIGCKMGGGKWSDYEPLIKAFARQVKAKVFIVKYDE